MPLGGRAPLYDPQFEHDGCGVGFVANIAANRTHEIVEHSIEAVRRVAHRGAFDADAKTGDGSGLMLQVPSTLFRQEYERLTRLRPTTGPIGVGMLFLPPRSEAAHPVFKNLVEEVFLKRGMTRFVWRHVPTDDSVLGDKGLATKPAIQQLLVVFPEKTLPIEADRELYAARREIESRAAQSMDTGLYVVSFSCRTIVYKGLLTGMSLADFFPDLRNPEFKSAFGMFHQRYSTNTFPNWHLAQPFRMLAHNGELNTIQGNRNWTRAREGHMVSDVWGDDIDYLRPVIPDGASDSANLDNVLELLTLSGRSAPHAMVMLIREAWKAHSVFNDDVRAFFEYHACLNEPWDGPAAVVFSDGDVVGAILDRNGLRPARYEITRDGLIVLGSEVGLLNLDDSEVVEKGRLGSGNMIAVDLVNGRLVAGKQIKRELAARRPYRSWVAENLTRLPEQPVEVHATRRDREAADTVQQQICFGYSAEEFRLVLEPMVLGGKEPVGSMGDDTPLAVLSGKPKLLSSYFAQRFAQVTNPPIDSIRERAVMNLSSNLGRRRNWLAETPEHARQVRLASPIISDTDLDLMRSRFTPGKVREISLLCDVTGGVAAMREHLDTVSFAAEEAAKSGCELLILSDRGVNSDNAPLPILLAVGAVNNHLLRVGERLQCDIVAESGEPRDVHQFATLIGYGAGAINPYFTYRSILEHFAGDETPGRRPAELLSRYREALNSGLLKILSKMGISILSSYRGAQIFEAVGINRGVIAHCFSGTPSRISGVGLKEILTDAFVRHWHAFGDNALSAPPDAGLYRFRRKGEAHAWIPAMHRAMVDLRREPDSASHYRKFALAGDNHAPIAIRDLLRFKRTQESLTIDEVESVESLRTRFTTAGMSLGALSPEAHEALAVAMNRIGGRSNTGEGGEDSGRFYPLPSGDSKNSAIKQVASGRFGVTAEYLVHATEIEIKMAQGSKPGEGGQLPGHKVNGLIARLRHSVPGVTLISPPPHHDIYSIEDLSQLIHDLKQVNPEAKICVKLVAQTGVGTVAAGVAKALADIILISGHDGGTGASPLASIKHAGGPWELGLAEAQQVLMLNNLRERVTLRTDGGLKTGRDVVVAAMLGAEEFNFGTAALVALGCVYVHQCHLNTCPVGIATQDPALRKKFHGRPEVLVGYLTQIAQDVREILAQIGVRSLDDIVGRADLLEQIGVDGYPATALVDLWRLIPPPPDGVARRRRWKRNHRLEAPLNERLVRHARGAIEGGTPVKLQYKIGNADRTVGATLAGEIARRYGETGLPPGTIEVLCEGSAGQSFAAWCVNGMRLILRGEANDYVCKGMSGGEVVLRTPQGTEPRPEEDVIMGNSVMYGATGGYLFARGTAGERFAVRNSGGHAVVEGVGDHGCEYMTNGVVVVLGRTGRNLAAGMTGGTAYVLDEHKKFAGRCNLSTVTLGPVAESTDLELLRGLIERHTELTASSIGARILDSWEVSSRQFWQVAPASGDTGAQECESVQAAASVPLSLLARL